MDVKEKQAWPFSLAQVGGVNHRRSEPEGFQKRIEASSKFESVHV